MGGGICILRGVTKTNTRLELWAGVECTQNRVGDRFFDQLDRTGHSQREGDIELLAQLGVRALRYPALWERIAPESLADADWSWTDRRLQFVRENGMRAIVGLVHHGSGPRHTSLVDDAFPEKLAEYARSVAERYPWVEDYTPVNEPLTTARFSGLYGLWYPHGTDDRTFVRTLLNELRGTVLAMRAIREVNAGARLIQTDDLGFIASTPALRYQTEFENERRWLGYDLLCGRVKQDHRLWKYLTKYGGASEHELRWFEENACPPDVIGCNYYLTSERFLDERVQLYPHEMRGGNYRDKYADLIAARVRSKGIEGAHRLLLAAWRRYGIPIAITECQNGCTREEQLRWVLETWEGCELAREDGADVRALTAWSVFGAVDWHRLVTQELNVYEPGVFDVRAPKPRATALAGLYKTLGEGQLPSHPLLEVDGWWHRPERLIYNISVSDSGMVIPAEGPQVVTARRDWATVSPLLITGASGTLGRALAHECNVRGIPHRLLSRADMDIADAGSVERAMEELDPWAVVNAAGYVRVDDAELEPERCRRENTLGPDVLAQACARRDIKLATFSSDLVFDGEKPGTYVESDAVNPLNEYGHSKAAAEREVLRVSPDSLVIRTSAFFSPHDEYNFAVAALQTLREGREFRAASDYVVSPTYVPDLVTNTLDLLIDGESGIWHLANAGAMTWFEFARVAAHAAGVSTSSLVGVPVSEMGWRAVRPAQSVLTSERAWIMPTLEVAIERFASKYAERHAELAAA